MNIPVSILPDGREVIPVHFLVETPEGYRIACSPNLTQMSALATKPAPYLRSEEARAVTCQVCQQTGEWRNALR